MKYDSKALKAMIETMTNLNDSEKRLLEETPIKVMPQNELQKIDKNKNYSILARAISDGRKSEILSSDRYPIIPKLKFGNIGPFGDDSYFTEYEIIPHELGHVRDYSAFGGTSEPSAIAFANDIIGRSNKTPVSAIDSLARSYRDKFGLKQSATLTFNGRNISYPGLGIDDLISSPQQRMIDKYIA